MDLIISLTLTNNNKKKGRILKKPGDKKKNTKKFAIANATRIDRRRGTFRDEIVHQRATSELVIEDHN